MSKARTLKTTKAKATKPARLSICLFHKIAPDQRAYHSCRIETAIVRFFSNRLDVYAYLRDHQSFDKSYTSFNNEIRNGGMYRFGELIVCIGRIDSYLQRSVKTPTQEKAEALATKARKVYAAATEPTQATKPKAPRAKLTKAKAK